jgi:hypothetical protein
MNLKSLLTIVGLLFILSACGSVASDKEVLESSQKADEITIDIPSKDTNISDINTITNSSEVATIDKFTILGEPSKVILQNEQYIFTPTVNYQNSIILRYSIKNLPTWLRFNSATGQISGIPTNGDIGLTDEIIISVTDGNESSSLTPFKIEVQNVNDAPTITGTPHPQAYEDIEYRFDPIANDIDANTTLTFRGVNFPDWLNIDTTSGKVFGTPLASDIGIDKNITIIVSDGAVSSSLIFSLEIMEINDVPILSGEPVLRVNEDSLYEFTFDILNEENDQLEFGGRYLPNWLSIDDMGRLSGVPTNEDVGINGPISIVVTDGNKASVFRDFNITVINVNDAPIVRGEPLTEATEDAIYRFTPDVIEIDEYDFLTFSATNLPQWAIIKPATGEIIGIPQNKDVGLSGDINISIVDDNGARVYYPLFKIEVINTNDAPIISGTPSTLSPVSVRYSFTPTATDEDINTTLSFSATNLPSWLTINSITGELSGIPESTDIGVYEDINISVTDGIISVSLDPLTITIIGSNKPFQTGQQTSYITLDDGFYKEGQDRAFNRDSELGIVYHNASGVMWQDNIKVKKQWLTDINYDGYRHFDTSGDTAVSYCQNLELGDFDDWRLPTIEELVMLTDKSKTELTFDDIFENIEKAGYWSSSSVANSSEKGWIVDFTAGTDDWSNKNISKNVKCIRNSEINSSFYKVENTNIVTDNITALQWEDNEEIEEGNFEEAISYCNNLELDGYDDWRVPNLNELYTIADRSIDLPALNNTFQNTRSEIYWSSTTVAISDTTAWIIDFYKAYDGWHNKDETAFIRCVRN